MTDVAAVEREASSPVPLADNLQPTFVQPALPPNTASTVSPAAAAAKTPEALAFERRLSGPAFARQAEMVNGLGMDSGIPEGPMGSNPESGRESRTVVRSASPTNAPGISDMSTLLTPTVIEAVTAHVLPERRLLLARGAFIDCTLETAIDSTLPGMTTCVTATDTFGADGKVVLLERGTKLIGETHGQVQQGSARVFVLWDEARTPMGVVVPLASPATDELGRAGLAGQTDRHFWDRFGAAILISVIDAAVQAAVQPSGGGTIVYSPSGSQEIMTEVLKGTINIPPTLIKHQGDRVQALVARDVDFRAVYELRAASEPR
jgi:type IV secretion system protein VirB10